MARRGRRSLRHIAASGCRVSTKDLIRSLEDGKSGFEQAADRLADSDQPQLASKMRDYASERAAMSRELEALAASYGDDIDEDGSVAAAVHRGWMAIKDVGDGTVRACLESLANSDSALAIVPLGTSNLLALNLGIESGLEAATSIGRGRRR